MHIEQPLSTYRAKRRFGVTLEPKGARKLRKGGNSFVIQQHDATRMHYDFRLEIDGVMVSWAVPKGPSLSPADKRLAVQTEDHPVEYNSFEGIIPDGEYGGGPVIVWDRGTWIPEGDPQEGLRKGRLTFTLDGEKLQGKFTLTRTGKGASGPKSAWLLIKRSDEHVRNGDDSRITELQPLSVISGRSVQDLGKSLPAPSAGPGRKLRRQAQSSPDASGTKTPKKKRKRLTEFPPRGLGLQLATLTDRPPAGDHWAYEIKLDGYRMLAIVDGAQVKLISRNDRDWTASFPAIVADLKKLKARQTVVDGEICFITAEGRSDFQSLQNALDRGRGGAASDQTRLFFYAFDLLIDDSDDIRDAHLLDRKQRLHALLGKKPPPKLQFSQHLKGNGALALSTACAANLEGLIAKRVDAPYQSGRTTHWLKLKCHKRQEFIIVGMTAPKKSRQGFGALLLAVREGHKLVFKGKVGTGFTAESLRTLSKTLSKLITEESPVAHPPRMRDAVWVQPRLVCEVEFTEYTSDGLLRHPSFQGLREDKPIREVVEEKTVPMKQALARTLGGKKKGSGGDLDRLHVAGVSISHPERIVDQASGVTKGELAQYHDRMAKWLLPHAAGRPLAVVRCPQGDAHQCFFQKQKTPGLGAEVKTSRLAGHEVIYVQSKTGVLELVQFNVIEFHGWGAALDNARRPDRVVMDLDPDTAVPFSSVVEAALELREVFRSIGLQCWVKTTGGKGLHVVIPLRPKAGWDEVKAFAHGVAEALAQQSPERYVANMAKAKRKGKIFIDYLRNGEGATAVLPYSPRARPGAPVAMPVEWHQLRKIEPRQFTVRSALDWIAKRKADPWAELLRCRQELPRVN